MGMLGVDLADWTPMIPTVEPLSDALFVKGVLAG